MPETAEEQLAGAAAVSFAVEAEGQVADVQVDGEGDDGEVPGGDVQHGRQGGQSDQSAETLQHFKAQRPEETICCLQLRSICSFLL